jgi:hypothetical protein
MNTIAPIILTTDNFVSAASPPALMDEAWPICSNNKEFFADFFPATLRLFPAYGSQHL